MSAGSHTPLALAALLIATISIFHGATAADQQKAAGPGNPSIPPSSGGAANTPRSWLPLEADGLHDPANASLKLLQQPSEALSVLPPANEGNQVDWAAALRSGAINPRTNIYPETKVNVLDLDVVMENTAGMPMVRFPHRPHTEWLDCSNCHDRIFIPKAGANPINMLSVLQGKYCGQCHGAVSFPLTQCKRCHSLDRAKPANAPMRDAK